MTPLRSGFVALALLLSPAGAPHPDETPVTAGSLADLGRLQTGDVIFRRGHSLISRAVLRIDRGSEYSHVGIVVRTPRAVYVLHTAPPSGSDTASTARLDPLDQFLSPERASAVAVYRLAGAASEIPSAAAARALSFAAAHIPFDADFSLTTRDRMYCTELVWRAYREVGVDLIRGRELETIWTPAGVRAVVRPSDLMSSPALRLLTREVLDGQ
jgi:cell wall-associated NlpC family hydrolase